MVVEGEKTGKKRKRGTEKERKSGRRETEERMEEGNRKSKVEERKYRKGKVEGNEGNEVI